MSDFRIKMDTGWLPEGCRKRAYLNVVRCGVPAIRIEVMYVDSKGDDDADICTITTESLDDLRTIRDALNQALGESS